MRFHTSGDAQAPVVVLIHGVLTPWQVWQHQIAAFQTKYHVIAVALDAHTEEETSKFHTIEQEAMEIADYLCQQGHTTVFAVCGISMGGVIAQALWKTGRLQIQNLVLDGAPLTGMPRLVTKLMADNYWRIIQKSKQRDPATLRSFQREFLPETYLAPYLRIADRMEEASMRAIIASVGESRLWKAGTAATRLLYLHGTRGNEVLAISTAKQLRKAYPHADIVCWKGCKHCEKAIYAPQESLRTVENWLAKAV